MIELSKALVIMKKYINCPICGSNKIGNGKGAIIIEENTFIRSCKCGWSVKTDENGKVIE